LDTIYFLEADFHKVEGRETLSRSYRDLNTTGENAGLTDVECVWEFKLLF
jgi:hypothetical protein